MKFRPWHVFVIVGVAVAAMAALATGGDQPGAVVKDGSVITMTVSRADATTVSTFDIVLLEGGDAEHESTHIFQSLDLPGIATISMDAQALSLTIAHDAELISESELRQRLAQSGYLKRTIADAVPAELHEGGDLQTLHLTPGDALEPSFVRAKAGIPLTITFGAGTGHLTSVSIPALEITQDITTEGSEIRIDEPVPGTYELVCAEGYTDATLVIE